MLAVLVDAGLVAVPVEVHAGGLEDAPGGLGQLGAGAVAGDEGHVVRHGSLSGGCAFAGRERAMLPAVSRPATRRFGERR